MLYIFLVDTGTMLNFDMNLAVESVSHLQAAIADECQIPVDKQVLLISGGENLDPAMRVCSYHAGTDTNPIFLFSKSTIEAAAPPSPSVYGGSDGDLKYQVEGSLNMQPSFETVVSRVQLALQISDLARDEVSCCESLVHDQHLQQQGWAAVVANLEDISSAFGHRSNIFKQNFEEFLVTRSQYFTMLSDFSTVLTLLSKMPLLPCLLPQRQNQQKPADLSKCITLLQWISSQDQRSTLQQMAEQCLKALEQFDESVLNNLMTEINTALEAVDNASMKEIKGLGDRLFGLEQLMAGARKIVQEQGDMSQGFVQNQERVTKLNDPSILPDLCASHQKQLIVMLKNHSQLRDIRRRCTLAKEELSANLHARLRWIMYVEKQISDIDSKMVIYHENLKRLRRRLEVVEQIDMAPRLYAMAVVEVYRRKLFSSKFMQWATKLTDESSNIQGEEISRRMEFSALMGKHFLHGLFPGIDDYPSAFAREIPEPFDARLPEITDTDITQLRQEVPELATVLRIPSGENFMKDFEEHHQEVMALKSLTARSPLKELPEGNETSLIGNVNNQPQQMPSKDGTVVAEATKNAKMEEDEDSKRLSLSFEKVENVLDEEFQKMAEEQRQSLIKIDEVLQDKSPETPVTNVNQSPFVSFTDQNDDFVSAPQSLIPDLTSKGRHDTTDAATALHTDLMQKSIQLVKVQNELETTKTYLANEQEKFKKLLQTLDKTRSNMKLDMQSLEKDIQNEKEKYGLLVGDAREKFIQAVESVKAEHDKEKSDLQKMIDKVKQSSKEMEEMYQNKLKEQLDRFNSLQEQAKQLQEQLKSSGDNAQALQQNYESKIQEITNKLIDERNDAVASTRQELTNHIREMGIDIKSKEKVIAELALEKDQLAKDLTAGLRKAKRS
ncbi:RB1-inducible coiled-coil protein 1-like [Ptychodera flava]|uniref:RB1-inducible coiled-coil protein 1-like n=1 Tax=Ptychodera flava TaxID=63121 RepID=UPI003969E7D2